MNTGSTPIVTPVGAGLCARPFFQSCRAPGRQTGTKPVPCTESPNGTSPGSGREAAEGGGPYRRFAEAGLFSAPGGFGRALFRPKSPPPLRSWPGRSRIRPPAVPFRCMVRTKLLFNPIVILVESWYIDCKVTAVHRPRGVASASIRHPLKEILRIPSAPPAVDSDSKDKDKGESL